MLKAGLLSVGITAVVSIVFAFEILGLLFAVRDDSFVYYVQKDNENIKIVSSYINKGAYGGGTKRDDYTVMHSRPIGYFFKIDTPIDTLTINKNEWRKPVEVWIPRPMIR